MDAFKLWKQKRKYGQWGFPRNSHGVVSVAHRIYVRWRAKLTRQCGEEFRQKSGFQEHLYAKCSAGICTHYLTCPLLQIEILKVPWSKQLAPRCTTGNVRTFLPETMLAAPSSIHWGNANWADKKVEVREKISELEWNTSQWEAPKETEVTWESSWQWQMSRAKKLDS